ncbi:methionine synthase II (cobalamin-independent) [Streptomyces sp. 846.5]|nr:methionine synthase [Streptomyces sp. 846.5]TDT98423.1 methionine synthase II (cobalamin-independent) [Streptomyces sp. 846.5]
MADDFKYHIDHHAGLTPQVALTDARAAHLRGELDDAGLRAAQDAAVAEAVSTQRRLGLSAVSDGWFRRSDPLSVVHDQVSGFGDELVGGAVAELLGAMAPVRREAVGPLAATGRLAGHESAALRAVTEYPLLVSLPSPGYVAELSVAEGPEGQQAKSVEETGAALAAIVGREVAALAAEGVAYVLLHNPLYGFLLSARGAERAAELGLNAVELVERMLVADAGALEGLEAPVHFHLGLDLTTGGAADLSAGYAAGPLAAFQERQPFDRICVEYPALEQARFPLSGVRPGVVVSLGLVDVRTPGLESVDEIVSRVDAAAAEMDIDDIALSTNGPFTAGHGLTANQERLKLQLVEMTARYMWGNEL